MPDSLKDLLSVVAASHRPPESSLLPNLIAFAHTEAGERAAIRDHAARLVAGLRSGSDAHWIAEFLREYRLDSREGLVLLQLAEAYLRVPDAHSAQQLLRDKLGSADWRLHAGGSSSTLVNVTTFGLVLAGVLVRDEGGVLRRLLTRTSETFIQSATSGALRMMARHFVLGENIEEGLAQARGHALVCSFDMLGEAARTARDAGRYFAAYEHAIKTCNAAKDNRPLQQQHSISVKLSALHPRYEVLQAGRCVPELADRLLHLARQAAAGGMGLTVDAEESERLDLSLDIIERVARASELRNWQGLGIAVQAYQKRAFAVIGWADGLARETGRRLLIRLVKGAYWDTEIKHCQERGLVDYPVWLRKSATDVSYLACARRLLGSPHLYPAFATHNALTVATLLSWIGSRRDLEFQRLQGMGAGLHEALAQEEGIVCRVYAPIGGHRELLAYLVRRMLENGANSSFIHQLGDRTVTEEMLLADPVEAATRTLGQAPPSIPLPAALFGEGRRNSAGLDLADRSVLAALDSVFEQEWSQPVSDAILSTREAVGSAVVAASLAADCWAVTPLLGRVACLRRLADLLERDLQPMMALLIREARKTRSDALGEVREAVDFCRYYATEAETVLRDQVLPGPTGEQNILSLRGRGVFGCISPWNFPLSIFTGQIAAALVSGNAVVAKPAPQTPLVARAVVALAREAAVPEDVLHLLTGGADIGDALVGNPHISGIVFTGSTATARRIAQRLLADEGRQLVPFIAETGGVNAMIVDSTALTEQVCSDVIVSAFQSAGQRCSALRLLCLQDDIHDRTVDMIRGAMAELRVGDPADESTDVGPLIDGQAHERIRQYLDRHRDRILYSTPLQTEVDGWFIAPTLLALDQATDLKEEVFGPVLHVVRWQADGLDELIDQLNLRGYGLTMGLHTRLDSVVDRVRARARVGSLYVNRSMIGAVVGSQPFGGEGLSGTGPKAGGPHYLLRFCTERSISIDTTAAGGNASLMSLDPDS